VQRIFNRKELQISVVLDKLLNILIYRSSLYVITYRSYKLLNKTVQFFWAHAVYNIQIMFCITALYSIGKSGYLYLANMSGS